MQTQCDYNVRSVRLQMAGVFGVWMRFGCSWSVYDGGAQRDLYTFPKASGPELFSPATRSDEG